MVADTKYNNLRETSSPTIYDPLRQIHGVTLEVRTATDPLSVAPALRAEIQTANPAVRVTNIELQSTRIENTIVRERLLAFLSGSRNGRGDPGGYRTIRSSQLLGCSPHQGDWYPAGARRVIWQHGMGYHA